MIEARVARLAGMLAAFALGLSCADRSYRAEDYGACAHDEECSDAALCSRTGPTDVCRPSCDEDSDCPPAGGAVARCGLDGEATGECVLPCGDCPDGMVCVNVSPAPTSPLVCVWES